jgi:anti-sigma factor RsiW
MNCREIRELKHAWFDGELDLAHSLQIEEHLKSCPDCSRALDGLQQLRTAIKSSDLYHRAPASLERGIRSAIAPAPVREPQASPRFSWAWLRPAAFAGLAAVGALAALLVFNTFSSSNRLVQEVASAHIRSLMPGHLMDVASTDQHTVKPWFAGKLDFSPPVTDFADHGFPLVGGRLDYLAGRPVAAMVYQRQKHIINLFVWPAPGPGAASETTSTDNGYNLVRWRQNGMDCWAVSDLNRAELRDFAALVRGQSPHP